MLIFLSLKNQLTERIVLLRINKYSQACLLICRPAPFRICLATKKNFIQEKKNKNHEKQFLCYLIFTSCIIKSMEIHFFRIRHKNNCDVGNHIGILQVQTGIYLFSRSRFEGIKGPNHVQIKCKMQVNSWKKLVIWLEPKSCQAFRILSCNSASIYNSLLVLLYMIRPLGGVSVILQRTKIHEENDGQS